jgi:ribosome-associated translation inhibitor RaiA
LEEQDGRLTEEERCEKILQFVTENPKCTKAEVIRFMGLWSSVMTCHYDITRLVSEGKLSILKDKPNSQTHHLIINNENQFNFINQELLKIETVVTQLIEEISKLHDFSDIQSHEAHIVSSIKNQLDYSCKSTVEFMLQCLLVLTSKSIHSEKDSQLFYTKIGKLIAKLHPEYFNFQTGGERLNSLQRALYDLPPDSKAFEKKRGINTELSDNIVIQMQNFKKRLQSLL